MDPAAPPPRLRVNDLYTAEVAERLALDSGGSLLANVGLDRNRVDLNRSSEAVRSAPVFLDLLREEVEWILERHPTVRVFFVHGWHVGHLQCDVGVGARETPTGLRASRGASVTVGEDALAWIARLRETCGKEGVAVTVGARYPAASAENLVQLFGRRGLGLRHPSARRLAELGTEGRVDALQLELSAPLRWPGPWRERFLGAVRRSFRKEAGATDEGVEVRGRLADLAPRSRLFAVEGRGSLTGVGAADGPAEAEAGHGFAKLESGHRPEEPHGASEDDRVFSLEAYDPAADLALWAGAGNGPDGRYGARLLCLFGGSEVALFTGERAGFFSTAAFPIEFSGTGDDFRLVFSGPVLCLEDGRRYADLEAALASSVLEELSLRVRFRALLARGRLRFGRLEGEVVRGSRVVALSTEGLAGRRRASALRQSVLAAWVGDLRLLARSREGEAPRALVGPGGGGILHPRPLLRFETGANPSVEQVAGDPEAISIAWEDERLRAVPRARVSILRSVDPGYLRIDFGVARVETRHGTGWGLYEFSSPVSPAGGRIR
ncbi:MAG: hypothetical protein KatS3mg076_1562 [Candidatus Binatia bacterium]|nr:MAG: hypothetical protein KatS3mg076_1562 [Candidatus Binatia bacterium]